MEWLNITKFLIILVFCCIFIWDLTVMFFCKDLTVTISHALYTISREHPIIPFSLGVLTGHVFWPLTS